LRSKAGSAENRGVGETEAQKPKLKTDAPVDASMLVRAFTGSLKPTTRTAYLYSLNQFRAWCNIETLVELAEKLCAITGAEANLMILRYTASLSGRTC